MKRGNLYFYLILNTEGRTSWQYENKDYWNRKYDEMLSEVKGLKKENDYGFFKTVRYCCELEKNRIKAECYFNIYGETSFEILKLFDDFTAEVVSYIDKTFKENKATLVNTDIFWNNADTIIFDDEPLEGSLYQLEVLRVDSAEGRFSLCQQV